MQTLLLSVAFQTAAPMDSLPGGRCVAVTPAATLLQFWFGRTPEGVLTLRPSGDSAWPEGELEFRRTPGRSDSFRFDAEASFFVRVGSDPRVMTVQLYHRQDDGDGLPVAHGLCDEAAPSVAAVGGQTQAPNAAAFFDSGSWQRGCHVLTSRGRRSVVMADFEPVMSFRPADPRIWAQQQYRLHRASPPPFQNERWVRNFGNFHPLEGGAGPTGYEWFTLDRRRQEAAILVTFSDLGSDAAAAAGEVGIAICGMKAGT